MGLLYNISVVIITYNREHELKKCLLSIVSQDYPKEHYEIIVIDDGSVDGTERIVSSFLCYGNVRYVKSDHKGCGAARNRGIERSNYELVTFVADDYIFDNNWISHVNNFFQEHKHVLVARTVIKNYQRGFFSRVESFHWETSLKIQNAISRDKNFLIDILKGLFCKRDRGDAEKSFYFPASGCAVFKHSVFESVGLYNEALIAGEDTEMGLRLSSHNIPIYLYNYPVFHNKRLNLKSFVNQFLNYGYWAYYVKKNQPGYFFYDFKGIRGLVNLFFYFTIYPVLKSSFAGNILDFIMFYPFIFFVNILFLIGLIRAPYVAKKTL